MSNERQLISSGSPWELTVGYSRAVRYGSRVFIAGTAPQFPDGEPCPEDAALQTHRCFEIIGETLETAGGSYADIVRTRVYLVDAADFEAVGAVHGEYLHDVRPANTTLVVAALLDSRWKVEIEVEAILSKDRQSMW